MNEILKSDKRFLLAKNETIQFNISLDTNINSIEEYDQTKILSLVDLFNQEREKSFNFRFYGNINYISFLNNKVNNFKKIEDLFNDDSSEHLFENNFTPYLLTFLTSKTIGDITQFNLKYKTQKNQCKLSYFGYGKNIYNEKNYNYQFNDIYNNPNDLIQINDSFIFNNHITLFLKPEIDIISAKTLNNNYSDYKNTLDVFTTYGFIESALTDNIISKIITDSNFNLEKFKQYYFNKLIHFLKLYNLEITNENIENNLRFIRNYLNIGNDDFNKIITIDAQTGITSNFFTYDLDTLELNEIKKIDFVTTKTLVDTYNGNNLNEYINLNYSAYTVYTTNTNNNINICIDFKFIYNPIFTFNIKKTENFINRETNPTLVPDYAIYDSVLNNFYWKNLMPYSSSDNHDFTFINNTHYLYNDLQFYYKPDLSDLNTTALMFEFIPNLTTKEFISDKSQIKINKKINKLKC